MASGEGNPKLAKYSVDEIPVALRAGAGVDATSSYYPSRKSSSARSNEWDSAGARGPKVSISEFPFALENDMTWSERGDALGVKEGKEGVGLGLGRKNTLVYDLERPDHPPVFGSIVDEGAVAVKELGVERRNVKEGKEKKEPRKGKGGLGKRDSDAESFIGTAM